MSFIFFFYFSCYTIFFFFFFFNDTATTEIYTLSLHDALPIFSLASFPPVMCRMTALAIASLRRPPFSGRAALASAPGLDALQRVAQAALLATEVPGVEWVRQDHTVGPYGRKSSVSIRVLPFRVLP